MPKTNVQDMEIYYEVHEKRSISFRIKARVPIEEPRSPALSAGRGISQI